MNNEELYRITGDIGFAINTAYQYEFGLDGIKKDIHKAIEWYKIAGDVESMVRAKKLEKRLKS